MADEDIYVPPPGSNFSPIAPPQHEAPIPVPAPSPPNQLDPNTLSQLTQQGYTTGLANALAESCNSFPLRIWVVDNSGSMNNSDGNRLVPTQSSKDIKCVPCTRWKEIVDTIGYHSQMAALLGAPTIFRLLNPSNSPGVPQEFSVADKGPEMIEEDLRIAGDVMSRTSPSGVTPLSRHVREIKAQVETLAPSLRNGGKRVAVILATDGLPSNDRGVSGDAELKEFAAALRSLEGLPIWLVIRLCTGDSKVLDFYNGLDNQLELSMEVIDDFLDEAKEMYEVNPWCNYCLPIHRMREMGFQHRLFDILDERKLTVSEVRDYCLLMFGKDNFDGVPEAEVDFKGFFLAVDGMVKRAGEQWHPVKKKPSSLISMKKLRKIYGDGTCTIM